MNDVFFERLETTRNSLESYLDDPIGNVQTIRVSIYALISAYDIIPKSNRTKKSDKLISKYRDFLSLHKAVYDYTIIIQKLKKYNYDTGSELFLTINKKQLKKLLKTIPLGEKISKSKIPKLKNIKPTKHEKKILTLLNNLDYTPNIRKLHSLRETVMQLLHSIELYQNNIFNFVNKLKLLQRLLDEICDCDIFICYMQKHYKDYSDISKMILSEKKIQNTACQKLDVIYQD